jgi:TRAP-type mannitol/chloroaromatic compound transport system permease small subunit
MMLMEYEFNLTWFIVGFLITCVGGLFMKYHQWVADNFGGGLGSYDRYKLAALITIGFGLIAMVNLHTIILGLIFRGLFSGLANG